LHFFTVRQSGLKSPLERPVLVFALLSTRNTKGEESVKKPAIFALAFSIGSLAGVAQAKNFTGEIMDSNCAKNGGHAQMEKEHNLTSDSGCTNACVKMGAKYVLFMNGKSYDLDDQTKPADFAGKRVKVTGKMDGNTIKVENISPAS
jgi:hypothetical protein